MNWIEQLLRVDPDGGNGVLEMLILGTLIALIVAVGFYVYSKSSIRNINL